MKPPALAYFLFVAITTISTGTIAQRHDAPGTSHGVVRVNGSGVIRGIDAPGNKITLEHETINKFKMEQATHEFDVKGQTTLGNLKEGDKVNFRLESSGRELVVVQISKATGTGRIPATSAGMPEAKVPGSDKKP